MNVILHGWPDDPKAKKMHQIKSYQDNIIVPVMIYNKTSAINYDLIYRFIYHDGEYYHYELREREFV